MSKPPEVRPVPEVKIAPRPKDLPEPPEPEPKSEGRYIATTVRDHPEHVEGVVIERGDDEEQLRERVAFGGHGKVDIIDTESPKGASFKHLADGSRWKVWKG